jgi:hypothetical protein
MGEEIRVESHLPERRRRSTVLLAHGCCCCCCLHTVGGIAGAAYGSLRRNAPSPETLTTDAAIRAEDEIRTANRHAAKVYWLSLALITLLAAIVGTLVDPKEVGVSLFIIVFFFPGGQLAASLAAMIAVHVKPPVRKAECLRRLGRITLFAFVGALAGVLGLLITVFTMSAVRG